MEQSSIKHEAAVGEAEDAAIADVVGVNESGVHISITLCMNCNVLTASIPVWVFIVHV